MTREQQVRLWDAINNYVTACGADPDRHVYGNTSRQVLVAEVEKIVRGVEADAIKRAGECAVCGKPIGPAVWCSIACMEKHIGPVSAESKT